MHQTVRALLSGIIDYAGLFPPAQLPLEQALRSFLRYLKEPEGWMLGRFICPAARLWELEAFHQDIAALPSPLVISALGRGGKDTSDFLAGVRGDLAEVARFRNAFGDLAVVDVYETKIPPVEAANQLYALIGTTSFLVETGGPPSMTPFFEAPSAERHNVERLLGSLAADRASPEAGRRGRCRPCGFKLRCGGLNAAAFPSAEQVAFALVEARDRGIPSKFTAGLHHPVRHFNAGVNARMHGFVNVFVAGMLAHTYGLAAEHVAAILEDEDARHFVLEDGLRWKEADLPLAHIVNCRHALLSFGSCSFDEPRDDLRNLGWLPGNEK